MAGTNMDDKVVKLLNWGSARQPGEVGGTMYTVRFQYNIHLSSTTI
jgi:hypothetical protein